MRPLLSPQKNSQPWRRSARSLQAFAQRLTHCPHLTRLGWCLGEGRGPPVQRPKEISVSKSAADPAEGTVPRPLISFGQSWCPQSPRDQPTCAQRDRVGSGLSSQPKTGHSRNQPGPQGIWNPGPPRLLWRPNHPLPAHPLTFSLWLTDSPCSCLSCPWPPRCDGPTNRKLSSGIFSL